MRYTLEQLKGMGPEKVDDLWSRQEFPFDLADCGKCATMHQHGRCRRHPEFEASAHTIPLVNQRSNSAEAIFTNLEAIYALRLFYDSLYPQPVSESRSEAAETVAVEK
jgi:hypothetical protein